MLGLEEIVGLARLSSRSRTSGAVPTGNSVRPELFEVSGLRLISSVPYVRRLDRRARHCSFQRSSARARHGIRGTRFTAVWPVAGSHAGTATCLAGVLAGETELS